MSRRMRQLERHIRILTYIPARGASGPATKRGTKIRIGTPDQGQDTRRAILCSKPKMFSILWDEYQNGIGGRLPAKDFTRQQRGGCKAVYSARKIFWDCMERLIDNGLTVQSALARINSVYHDGPITQKLIALRKDERKGGHSNFCWQNTRKEENPAPKHPIAASNSGCCVADSESDDFRQNCQ